jgi:hypothetical protein
MMCRTTSLLSIAALSTPFVNAHMQLTSPPPLRSKLNPHTTLETIDYSLTSPLGTDGSDFPCKGALSLLGNPSGASVAQWTAGEEYTFTVSGGAAHSGGSCQVSLSTNGGKEFRVLKSFEGGCPVSSSSLGEVNATFRFRLPGDTPAMKGAVFAWTWFNNVGNREMYMNCAVVDVVPGRGGRDKVPFQSRPALLVANIGNGCSTIEGKDVKFPDPGPDVEVNSVSGLVNPVGNCPASSRSDSPKEGSSEETSDETRPGSKASGEADPEHPGKTQLIRLTCYLGEAAANYCWTGYTPGNDWPDWFMSSAVNHHGHVYFGIMLLTVVFAFLLS